MKAKHFRKLRKRLDKVQVYTVKESPSLFGSFFECRYPGTDVSASSPIRAIIIYMRRYRKEFKRVNNFESEYYVETSEMWGKIMVRDEKGFMRFYS